MALAAALVKAKDASQDGHDVTTKPPLGVAHLVFTKDPKTGELRWARPVGQNRYTVSVAPQSAPLESGVMRTQAFVAAPKASVLEVPLAALGTVEQVLFPYALWAWTVGSYSTPCFWSSEGHRGNELEDGFWTGGSRALGMIHGFVDRSASCFGSTCRGGLNDETVAGLARLYGDQMFAFDRPTVLASPDDNAAFLLAALRARKPCVPLTLDLICHSQGGLVARALARRADDLADIDVKIGTIVFVATPNAGTALTHVGDVTNALGDALVRVYTKLFQGFAEKTASHELWMVLQILAIGGDAFAKAPGSQAMVPGGEYLKGLSAAPINYRPFAVAADFQTAQAGPAALPLTDAEQIIGDVFAAANDIIVPTAGVAQLGTVQIQDVVLCPPEAGVYHLNYFQQQRVRESLLGWLKDPAP
jgi:pimeloyl-ACP methyl ester carboxylesterase